MGNEAQKKEVSAFEEVQRDLTHIDIYRDTSIRYLGYSNEVGEAFRSLVPVSLVRLSYVAAFGYVCADALDKSRKVHKVLVLSQYLALLQLDQKPFADDALRRQQVAIAAGDTFLWQTFASVLLPGLTINRLCFATAKLLALKWMTTAVGLAAIPFIVRPIDAAVEIGMDRTVRQYYPAHLEK